MTPARSFFLLTACCLLLTFPFFLGPGTRDPRLALSTFDRAHRGHGFLLVSCDDREIPFLDRAQLRVAVTWISFIPIKAGKVFLRPGIFEDFTVTRINFVAHLADVFDEQTRE